MRNNQGPESNDVRYYLPGIVLVSGKGGQEILPILPK